MHDKSTARTHTPHFIRPAARTYYHDYHMVDYMEKRGLDLRVALTDLGIFQTPVVVRTLLAEPADSAQTEKARRDQGMHRYST